MSVTWRRPAGAGLALALVLAGCTSTGTQEAGTQAPALPGLTASLYQTRTDAADRQLQVTLSNQTGKDLVVRRMSLTSTSFAGPMTYPRTGSRVDAGDIDMPVPLGTAVCPDPDRRHTVRVEYELDGGRSGQVELLATDEGGRIEALRAAECLTREVEQTAELTVEPPVRTSTIGDALVAELTVTVVPRGTGDLTLLSVSGTPLLQHVDPSTGAPLHDGVELGLEVEGPTSFGMTLRPGRCDAHALAEDKQGTRVPVQVRLDGEEGRVVLAASDAVRVELYDFVREACR